MKQGSREHTAFEAVFQRLDHDGSTTVSLEEWMGAFAAEGSSCSAYTLEGSSSSAPASEGLFAHAVTDPFNLATGIKLGAEGVALAHETRAAKGRERSATTMSNVELTKRDTSLAKTATKNNSGEGKPMVKSMGNTMVKSMGKNTQG